MSEKEVFPLTFEIGNDLEESYQVVLDKVTDEIYTDGAKFFKFTESFVFVLEADEKGKEKKKRVAKRKGKDLVLTNKKDKIVFSPEVVVYSNSGAF